MQNFNQLFSSTGSDDCKKGTIPHILPLNQQLIKMKNVKHFIKPFTLIWLFLTLTLYANAQESLITTPVSVGNNIHICEGGQVVIEVAGTVSGRMYSIVLDMVEVQVLTSNGSNIIFDPVNFNTAGSFSMSIGKSTSPWIVSTRTINVYADPQPPTLTLSQAAGTVCAGPNISATLNAAGSDLNPNVAGTDSYQFSIDGGTVWNTYVLGTPISSTQYMIPSIKIKAIRSNNLGCYAENIYTWTIDSKVHDNSGAMTGSYCTIQQAIDAASTASGDILVVEAGTYLEDVTVNKAGLTISGAGASTTTVSGPIGGPGSTFQVAASGVVIEGFTITREGNNTTDWNLSLNSAGVAIQSQSNDAIIRNNKITGNRTGIDVNNSNDNTIYRNDISFNRTGLLFRNQTDNTSMTQNFVIDNWTAGILFIDASSGTNSPLQQALSSNFNDNNISGNWYGDIVDRQSGGSLPAPGTNLKNFECNWYGVTSPVVSTLNSMEPGYAALIPVLYGGSATNPSGAPNILGPASANFDYISWLVVGTDNMPGTNGFQPVGSQCSGTPVVITSATTTPNQFCQNNGTITVNFTGGTLPYTVSWTGTTIGGPIAYVSGSPLGTFTNGTYTLTVTDMNGSSATTSVAVVNLPVRNTNGPTYHATIQAAITAAASGNTIDVCAGTYNERVIIDKSLTLQGVNEANCILTGTGLVGVGSGITINNGITNVSISGLTVQNYAGSAPNSYAGIRAVGGNDNLTIVNTTIKNNLGGSGFYANGPITDVLLNNLDVSGHSNIAGAARGIVIWNGLKSNITITNCDVYNNNCCGIELQDGSGTGVNISNNNVYDNADNGLGIVGLQGPGANIISTNTVTNNGRFGIEIKNPNGNGASSGAGSVVVSNNTVTRNVAIGAEDRDIAGIAVFRRGVLLGNVDVPYGVQVNNNSVSGYTQPSTSDGFGIVLEGINHTSSGNTLNGNEVGIQRQVGHLPYPADGDQNNLVDTYFGRGNSPVTCGVTISGSVFGNITANGINTRDVGNSFNAGIVVNTNTNKSYCSIQAAIDDILTLNGHTITASAGTYNEQVIVSKELIIKSATPTKPIINFTGTPTGKPTLFDVTANNVTIENLQFDVDLSKLKSAVIASSVGLDNITIKDNLIGAYATPSSGTYGDRNAVSVNYGGNTDYRVAAGGVNSVTFTGNTVNGTAPASYFRSGISSDEVGLTATGNTLTTINHDVLLRFASNGANTISNNTFNGGGLELAEQNAGSGLITVSNNMFTGVGAPNTAVLRLKNNQQDIAHTISTNTFTNYEWAISAENMKNLGIDNNTFNTASATARGIVVNTKSISSNSNTVVQTTISASLTKNKFTGSGNAITFQNHDSDNDSYGSFTLGTTGNENEFGSGLSSFVVFDNQTGSSNGSTFPIYPLPNVPNPGNNLGWPTTMACWDQNLNAQNNKFDVGAGLQLPTAMNFADRTTLESKLTHDPDVACLGLITYFLPVRNITLNTYYLTIGEAVVAASPTNVIECSAWTYNERVIIDKSLTLQGVSEANCILTGTGLVGVGSGITINNGITNVSISGLTVQNYAGSAPTSYAGIRAVGGNNNLTIVNTTIKNNLGGSGFYANGPITDVLFNNLDVSGHSNIAGAARGIVIWNGLKSNITITNCDVYNNNCCGIELQDGSGTGVNISNNNVYDNADNGLGIVGLQGPGANIISGNTVTNNGRFGIEIKNPNGSGAVSGAGSILVSGNTVSRNVAIGAEVRDIAGIAVFRRGVLLSNVDVPYGVQVNNNSVSGYTQPSTSDGFGIVLEGINHTASGNTLNGNDVGIQRQAGHLPYPADGDQNNLADMYFGRGNSPVTCGVTISGSVFGNITANGIDTRDVGNSFNTGIVVNTNTNKSFCSIQAAINDLATVNGHTITASSGTYDEQVIVNKELIIKSATPTKPIINFTGTPTGKPTLFDVTANNVTIENLQFDVDLSKLKSAVIASSAGLDNIIIKDNLIGAYATPSSGTYGDRNAVSVNYGGNTNYRVAVGGVNSVTFTGNTVNGTAPASYFRSGISADEVGLTATGNTLTTINHDVLLRFASNGANNISLNNFNGGGLELAEQNAGSGLITVSNNMFTGVGAPNTAVLRLKNNQQNIAHTISTNTFTNYDWAISMENMNSVTLNANTFTGDAATDRHVVVNTKSISSNSNTIVQVPIAATMTSNIFNGMGIGLTFQNHDSDDDSYGTFTIGTLGNANTFAATLTDFIRYDNQTGSSNGSTFPTYPTTGGWPTTMACWDQNIDIQNNTFDVGTGLQLPSTMSFAERTTLETKLFHKPDAACTGVLTYFLPVHNLTQNTYYLTIGAAIAVANPNDVIECSAWTFNERVVIDKSLTLQGVDSANVVITGTGLIGAGSGIHINSGVTNVTIKKFKIQNYLGSGGSGTAGIFGQQSNSNLTIESVSVLNNPSNHGIFLANSSTINLVSITKSIVRNHGPGLRGIVIWDNLKTNITISDNVVTNNMCCGIELQDGDASKVTVTGNTVDIGGGDNAIGLTGLNASVGLNIISGNTITGGGRFGIEIKNPNGGVTVSSNNVNLSAPNITLPIGNQSKDRAGIAVFRRAIGYNNIDVPTGVTITGNTVTSVQQISDSEGFGIVIEGTNHAVTGNTVSGCDVGIQQQQNPSNYPGNADDSNIGDQYFGRGNSPITCGNIISGNTLNNTINTRNVGAIGGNGFVSNPTSGETFCSINTAIADAQTLAGHALNVSAGTFNENVTVNKDLTINGAGPTTILTPTVACSGNGITVSANNATVQNLKVTNFNNGLAVSSTGVLIDNVESVANCNTGLELSNGTTNLSVQNSKLNNNTSTGFRKGTAAVVSGFTLNNSEVKGNNQGCFVAKNNGAGGTFHNINITNSDFSNNTQKGMYFEALSNATIDGVVMNNSGTNATYGFNAGIDINLKYASYSNITIQNSEFTNCGAIGTATDPENPGAITIKARDDAPSYNTVPASLSTVLIKNNVISGPRNGIRFGEFGKINAGPSNVTLEGNNLAGPYAHKAVIRRTNNSINLVCNWHGTTDLPMIWSTFSQTGSGSINVNSILGSGLDGNLAVGFQPSGSCTCPSGNLVTNTSTSETFCTIQAAIDDAQTLGGHTLTVGPGTYIENVVVNKSLTINAPNSAIDPCSATRVPEAIITTAVQDWANGAVVFYIAANTPNVKISGFTIDGDNTALTSGVMGTNGADIDAAEAISTYETGVSGLNVSNNIIQNFAYFGVTLYDFPTGVPSSGHTISNNKIQNLGTYTATGPAAWANLWGGGVLLYNNQYAAVTNNCMTNVRLGVQTGNFYQANPGPAATISNNTIQARRLGVFHNLHYGAATSPITVNTNTITALNNTNETNWYGIEMASLSNPGPGSSATGNIINGSGISAANVDGFNVWNCQAPTTISGGTITDVKQGVNVNNFEGYDSNADNTSAIIDGVTIAGATVAGVIINDNALNTNNARVSAEVKNCTITNSAIGILVSGSDAGGNIHDNTVSGGLAGIQVNGSNTTAPNALTIQNNTVINTNQVVGANRTTGIALTNISGSSAATVMGNNIGNSISGPFYGYGVFNLNTSPVTTINGGTVKSVMQGVAGSNFLPPTSLAPSVFNIDGVTINEFKGNYPLLPDFNFHAGVYTFTGGSSGANTITSTISNVNISGTSKIARDCAGVAFADFSTAPTTMQNITVNTSTISNNLNRGIHARGPKTLVTLNNSIISGNGSDAFGAGGNDGFAIIALEGATVNANNNFITHPASSATLVTAFLTGNGPANTIIAHNNSVLMGGNANGRRASNVAGSTINATCNWWGTGVCPADLVSGIVSVYPYLTNGTDDNLAAGFQPVAGSCAEPSIKSTVTSPVGPYNQLMTSGNVGYVLTICSGQEVTTSAVSVVNAQAANCSSLRVQTVYTTTISTLPPTQTFDQPYSVTSLLPPTSITPQNHDGVAKNIVFVSTPYYDVNGNNQYDMGDVPGGLITFTLTVQPTPALSFTVTADGNPIAMQSGINVTSASYAATICSGELVSSTVATSSSAAPGACGPLMIQTSYTTTISNISPQTFTGFGPFLGNAAPAPITPQNLDAMPKTIVFTTTPYYEVDGTPGLTAGDVVGDYPAILTLTVQPAPRIVCPASVTVNNDPNVCSAVVSYSTPTFTEYCATSTIVQIAGLASGSVFPVGVTTNTWQITDGATTANTATCSFTVTVVDNTPPTYTILPTGASIAGYICGGTINRVTDPASCNSFQTIMEPVWADNCGVTLTSASATNGVVLNDLGAFVSGTFPKGSTLVTFTGTDAAGNTTTCSITIMVSDNIAPVFSSLPNSFTVAAPPGNCSLIVNWIPPVANDNCPGTVSVTSNFNPGAVFNVPTALQMPFMYTVTYTATDQDGNAATYSFVITVTGNCIPAVDLSVQTPEFALDPVGNFILPTPKDGVITIKNNGVNPSHELAPQGNVKVLVGVPSSTVFTTVGTLTPENDDWIITEYPSSPAGVKMYLFTLKPTLSIAPSASKTIKVRVTPVGYIGQKGVITAQLYNGSGGDVSTSNNYTQGSFQIAN